MGFSPRRSWFHGKLYRKGMCAVILAGMIEMAGAGLAAQALTPQFGHKAAVDKGPRALGLVQLSPKGNEGRLIPVVIMLDGKFYDAGSYKATPVPMALDFDTVYEAFRSGVSQGVFTITQPGQLNHTWIAEGTWLPAGAKAPEMSKKYATPVIEDKDAPPVLHRRSEKSDTDSGSDKKDKDKDKDEKGKAKDNNDKDQPKPATGAASPDAAKAPVAAEPPKTPAPDEPITDPNRPRLRRGKPDSSARREPFTTFDPLTDAAPSGIASASTEKTGANPKDSSATSPPIVIIPAISDAGGPDPRPYTYDVKPAEEASYRGKMLDLAAAQLHAGANPAARETASAPKNSAPGRSAGKSADKVPKPAFDDVNLRIFDLSNSNEPVLVLSAKAHPSAASASGSVDETQEITLIARTNLEGELRKLFFSQTDSRHLDVTPRLELIDVVDADGDGRGELLFRRTFEDGSAYAIYRVTADRLWPLFEGTP